MNAELTIFSILISFRALLETLIFLILSYLCRNFFLESNMSLHRLLASNNHESIHLGLQLPHQ